MNHLKIHRWLGLDAGELPRVVPFFAVYFLLFTALTIADGVAVSLFASRIGADRLPAWYSATAVLSLVMIGMYLTQATRHSGGRVFGWILGAISTIFAAAWLAYQIYGGTVPLGTLFVTREIALTMVLMHFGTFLQDYFLRSELNRLLPVIYAGGRLGGIIGGGMLGWLASRIGTVHLVPLVVILLVIAWVGIVRITQSVPEQLEEEELSQPALPTGQETDSRRTAIKRFLLQVCQCPLLGWLTATTLLFIMCRWFLAYQYTAFFEVHFDNDVELASFLGRYTQIALTISLFLQLFVVNRMVGWLGVSTTHTLYSMLVMGGLMGNVFFVGIPIAVASRFLESELRFGLRNPVNQMMVNRFAKKMRIVVRGWSLGWLIPTGTLIASGMIAGLIRIGPQAVGAVGILLGIAFVVSAIGVGKAYDQFKA
jgi:ATP/ADP translocase